MQFEQYRQIVTKMTDIHPWWVTIDFARVTRLNCGCHPLNVNDLAVLRDRVHLSKDVVRNLSLGALLSPLPFPLCFHLLFFHAIPISF